MPILYYLDPADGQYKPYVAPGDEGPPGDHGDLTGRDAVDAHPTASVSTLTTALSTKASTSQVDGKADPDHTHTEYHVSTVSATAPASPAVGDIWCQP